MVGRYCSAMDPGAMDFCLFVHNKTDKAILASETGEPKHAKWFPKSQIEIVQGSGTEETVISMPMWLAKEKGLI